MIYVVAMADLAVAFWLLWYVRVREQRNRAGVAVVGVMLVVCLVSASLVFLPLLIAADAQTVSGLLARRNTAGIR